MDIVPVLEAVESTGFAKWTRDSVLAFPLIEAAHVIALTLVFGTILIIFIFIFVCFLGLMLRAFRETQFSTLQNQSNGTCRDILSNFNSKCFSDYCPGGKYLPAGATCSKEFMASSWETDGSLRYVNPCCCNSFSVALLCPLYYAGIMSLLFVTAVIIAIVAWRSC